MASLKRMLAAPFLNQALKLKKHINASKSTVDYALLKNPKAAGSKNYPVIIRNSKVDNIAFGEGCRFFSCVAEGKVELGRFVTLAGPAVKVCGNVNGVSIGSFTSIGANTVIQEGEHDYTRLTTYFINRNVFKNKTPEEVSKGKINIQEGVWIGSNCVVLGGVTIGRGAVIGAGSVVTRDVPAYAICVGSPARVVKYRFSEETIEKIEKLKWWEMTENELKRNKDLFKKDFSLYLDEIIKAR